jgi:hypothetical protein
VSDPGCLLETNRPIGPPATRVAGDLGALAKQPIPPLYIVSSSFQGVALMQYDAKGEDELSMRKDEQLRVLYVLLVVAVLSDRGSLSV